VEPAFRQAPFFFIEKLLGQETQKKKKKKSFTHIPKSRPQASICLTGGLC